MMWINGVAQQHIVASDRGLQFGDGCFTTAAVRSGRIHLLAKHLARLREACQRLMIADVDWSLLEHEMIAAADSQSQTVLKVIITRGSGGRGYSTEGCAAPTRIMSLSPWPTHYEQLRLRGAWLAESPIRLGVNPQLAGIKHLNRLEQVLIRQFLAQQQADDLLVCDSDGNLVECCAANLFWRSGEGIFTPRTDRAGVNGIMRRFLMAQLNAAGHNCQEVAIGPEALVQADEVLMCNALMPVIPVKRIGERCYPRRDLADWLYDRYIRMEGS